MHIIFNFIIKEFINSLVIINYQVNFLIKSMRDKSNSTGQLLKKNPS
ncbi:MAG: hypothetical protein ACRYE8_03245 [Janthinobacterium lividum]